jgi:hypothetical protein
MKASLTTVPVSRSAHDPSDCGKVGKSAKRELKFAAMQIFPSKCCETSAQFSFTFLK